jgi:hypothetical protein
MWALQYRVVLKSISSNWMLKVGTLSTKSSIRRTPHFAEAIVPVDGVEARPDGAVRRGDHFILQRLYLPSASSLWRNLWPWPGRGPPGTVRERVQPHADHLRLYYPVTSIPERFGVQGMLIARAAQLEVEVGPSATAGIPAQGDDHPVSRARRLSPV